MAVVRLELSVDILLIVAWVFIGLESLAVIDIIALKLNGYNIEAYFLVGFWDVDPMTIPQIWSVFVQFLIIDNNLSDKVSFVINEKTL